MFNFSNIESNVPQSYYCVEAKTSPWTYETRQVVGYYLYEQTARKVVDFIRDLNINEIPGGIDVTLEHQKGVIIKTPAGYRLKETPRGCITMIKTDLNREEYQRLLDIRFKVDKIEIIDL